MDGTLTELGISVHVDEAHEGYYRLSMWARTDGRGISETSAFARLSYTELIDVVLALMDENRPGTKRAEGCEHIALW